MRRMTPRWRVRCRVQAMLQGGMPAPSAADLRLLNFAVPICIANAQRNAPAAAAMHRGPFAAATAGTSGSIAPHGGYGRWGDPPRSDHSGPRWGDDPRRGHGTVPHFAVPCASTARGRALPPCLPWQTPAQMPAGRDVFQRGSDRARAPPSTDWRINRAAQWNHVPVPRGYDGAPAAGDGCAGPPPGRWGGPASGFRPLPTARRGPPPGRSSSQSEPRAVEDVELDDESDDDEGNGGVGSVVAAAGAAAANGTKRGYEETGPLSEAVDAHACKRFARGWRANSLLEFTTENP